MASVELAHLVDVRDLEVQARLDVGLDHPAEAQHDRALGLLDYVDAVPQDDGGDDTDDQSDQRLVAHQRLSLVRASCWRRSLTIRDPRSEALALPPPAEAPAPVAGAALRPSIILSSGR